MSDIHENGPADTFTRDFSDSIELVKNHLGEHTELYSIRDESLESMYGMDLQSTAKTIDGESGPFAAPQLRKMIEFAAVNREQPIWIGIDTNSKREIGIPRDRFFKHMLILGTTGKGKTTLLNNIHQQLIYSHTGLLLIDGKGDNSRPLLRQIPEWRLDDVVYLDVGGATGYVSGFNYLDTSYSPSDPVFDRVVRSIVSNLLVLVDADSSVGDYFENILTEIVDAMVQADLQFNLSDLYVFLDRINISEMGDGEANNRDVPIAFKQGDIAEKNVQQLLETDTELIRAIQHLDEVPKEEIDIFKRKLGTVLRKSSLRQLINQRDSDLKIADAINNNKIIILRLTGPTDERQKLGTALLRRVWAVLRSRTEMPESERNDFFISIDEGQNIVDDGKTIPEMLREARGYNVGMLFATQNLAGIDTDTTKQLYSNADTTLSFGLGGTTEAEKVASQLGIDSQNLIQESQFHVWLRIDMPEKGQRTQPMRAYTIPPYPPMRTKEARDEVEVNLIKKYGSAEEDESSYAPFADVSLFK